MLSREADLSCGIQSEHDRCGAHDVACEHADQLDEKRAAELRKYYPTWKQADFDSFGEDLIKLALLWLDDIEKDVYPTMRALESETLCVSVTAYTWIDVFHRSVSKGSGVKALQEKLGIGKEETVVFGDYLNDLPMAEHACRSFAPMNAHPAVKAAFTQVVAGHLEGGVTRTIQALIREAENRE